MLVATETDRGLFFTAPVAAGHQVIAVNPLSTSPYRERPVEPRAQVRSRRRADAARARPMDGHNHRPSPAIATCRGGQGPRSDPSNMIWMRQRTSIRCVQLRESSTALEAFDDLASGEALSGLAMAPTPMRGRGLSQSKIATALRRGGRQRRIDERAAETRPRCGPSIFTPRRWPKRCASVAALVAVTTQPVTQIDRLEQELADRFEQHPDAKIIRSLPGLGTILVALAELGMTRTDSTTTSLARTTPARHPAPAPRASVASCSAR